jgi:hypothetical protein
MVVYSPSSFLFLGLQIADKKDKTVPRSNAAERRFFTSAYGSSPEVCCHTWEYINHYKVVPKKAVPYHLLWSMLFMKSYATEAFLSALVGTTEKTFRKWVWLMIKSISGLYNKVVRIFFINIFIFTYY